MAASKGHKARITCQFSHADGKRPNLDQLDVVADTHSCRISFNWSWAAATVLRQDLMDYLTGLAVRCFPDSTTTDEVTVANFLGQLPGLTFENLTAFCGDGGAIDLHLHARFDSACMFFEYPPDGKTSSVLEDVFLPLTNLSAYLTAMTDRADQDGPGQALNMTAQRIDEFLLIYGDRLQNGETNLGQLAQRPK